MVGTSTAGTRPAAARKELDRLELALARLCERREASGRVDGPQVFHEGLTERLN